MPIVKHCSAPGCETLTMGPLCIEHEQQLERMFVRGRPFVRATMESRRPTTASKPFAPSLRRALEQPAAARALR